MGRGHDWSIDRHMPDAKLCISESSSHTAVGRDPETWRATIVHQVPKAGSVSCPLFTNAPGITLVARQDRPYHSSGSAWCSPEEDGYRLTTPSYRKTVLVLTVMVHLLQYAQMG